jgi:hypothetical protein
MSHIIAAEGSRKFARRRLDATIENIAKRVFARPRQISARMLAGRWYHATIMINSPGERPWSDRPSLT